MTQKFFRPKFFLTHKDLVWFYRINLPNQNRLNQRLTKPNTLDLSLVSYFSRQAIFWAELRSSHLPGCDWLAGLENTLNCRQYCRQICGSSNTISLLRIFGNPNKMLDWRTNPNLILLTNIRVCPSILYSNAGFNAESTKLNKH